MERNFNNHLYLDSSISLTRQDWVNRVLKNWEKSHMSSNEIKSEKILVKKVFSDMWFRIPEYQRPYVWGADEINDLLDDFSYAMQEKPESEYFLGSFVFQEKEEKDLLDGQQRMITLWLLFSVIRDMASDENAKTQCQECIFQKENLYKKVPERPRITFHIRPDAQEFIDKIAKDDSVTKNDELISHYTKPKLDISTQNMAKAISHIKDFFSDEASVKPEDMLMFLLNKVLLIYVSTENLDDAFKLFTILNNRGVPLRNSDILKSINLGAVANDKEKGKYAKLWEDAESELGENFDRFLNHIRTILVKEKARLNLLQEFEDKIYTPKEKPALLTKGEQTFQTIKEYLDLYKQIFYEPNDVWAGDYKFDNLIKVMDFGLPSSDWIPPLLRYFERFGKTHLYNFLQALDNKFSADWIMRATPSARIDAMNTIIKKIDEKNISEDDILVSDCLAINYDDLKNSIENAVYGEIFTRYLLLKLDFIRHNHDHNMNFRTLSVEHILPQNPAPESQWTKDFSDDDRDKLTNKLGNLVLITRRKNASQGRLDYSEKKHRYFQKNIDTCPNSLHILQTYDTWTPNELNENQNDVINKIMAHYRGNPKDSPHN